MLRGILGYPYHEAQDDTSYVVHSIDILILVGLGLIVVFFVMSRGARYEHR